MNKKIIWGVIALVIIGLIIWAVSHGYNGASGTNGTNSTKEPIKIGAVLSLSGFASPWGEFGKNGINLAVKTINANGGIDGRQVEVVIEDDHTDGKQAVSAYTKLQSVDKVQGVIGGVFDFVAQPLIPLAESSKQAFISPSNFRIAGGFELNDQSFVMQTDFSTVIRKLTGYISQSNIKKLAVVHFQSTFGNEIAKTLGSVMQELGRGQIVDESYAAIGSNDFKTTIAKLKAENVDAVFMDMVGNDPINFLTRSNELGFKPTFITYNGTLDSFVNEKDKALLENVVFINWEITSAEFAKIYKAEYGIEPTKSADKYFDSVYVMAKAIAESSDTTKVAGYIAENSFKTPNSTVTFTANHAAESTPVEIQVFRNGTITKWEGE